MYTYSMLPCDYESVLQWAPKFIHFRLNALQSAPDHTTSSYELEAAIPESAWVFTLSKPNPVFRVLLCTARQAGDEDDSLPVWEREWAGILCVYGPRSHTTHDTITSTWYMGLGFVMPLHRGSGTLRHIFNFGVQAVRDFDRRRFDVATRYETRVQIIAKANEQGTLRYYRTGGLQITEHLTLGEYSKRGWDLPICGDLHEMPIVVMEMVVETQENVRARL
ncbi:hypothetical protein BDV30DRAFT_239183 [Aspergillus minisclerotigenes]|uniref:N-acetyltransferase domain-containing protein n=1 Tax=Aspergillus minisclerotigenes TaxID=656917 RepID=A0A5N6J2K0_9EURO|nr:hypothetical protein BDV30DRAFT_239183 [Aspergillus minisclerotigenes]